MTGTTAERVLLNPALVGREDEMRLLRRKLAEARQGCGGVVLLQGEAGMGKTRLAEEVEREAEGCDVLFLRGAGDPQRTGLAYGALVEPLNLYLDQASPTERAGLRETVSELAPHLWSSLFPGDEPPAAETAELNPQLRQSLFLARLARLLLDVADRQPVVLCLEDLHCADSVSLQLFAVLGRGSAQVPLLILGTCQPGQPGDGGGFDLPKMLQELQLKSHVQAVTLGPLSEEQTRLLVASCFPNHSFSESLIRGLQRQSGGVPLLVMQLLDSLMEGGVLRHEGGRWVARPLQEEAAPASVRSALQERLQRLTPEGRLVLSFASVQGEAFEGRLVARTLGMPLNQVLRVLSNLVRTTRLLRIEDRAFRFVHGLLAKACYELLPEERRRQVHLSLGTILEEQRRDLPELLAYHFFQAKAAARALPYLVAAAQRACGAFAYHELRRFLDQADVSIDDLEAAAARPHRLELWRLRAELEDRAGNPDRALALCRQILERADPQTDRPAVAQTMAQMGWVEYRRGNWEQAQQLYWDAQRAFAELDDEPNRAMVYVRLGNIAFERGNLEEAAVHYREAKGTAVKCGSGALLGSIYGNLGAVASVRGQHLDAVLNYTEAQKAYQRAGHRYGLCQIAHNLGMTYAAREEWAAALECYARGLRLAREMGTVDVEANILVSQAVAQLRSGDRDGAAASCAQARAYMEQMRDRPGEAECDKVAGMLCHARAQNAEARAFLQQGRHAFAEMENRLGVAECDLELGRVLQESGESEAARQHLQDSRRGFAQVGAAEEVRRVEVLLASLGP